MNVVIDTNVFISGIFWTGPPYQILKAWHYNKFDIVVTQEILEEYQRVAEQLSKKYKNIDIIPIIELVATKAKVYQPIELSEQITRDIDDDKFISGALAGKSKIADEFFIKLHFLLTLRYVSSIKIIDLDLEYEVPGFPVKKNITIDEEKQSLDASYRMQNFYELKKDSIANVYLSKNFMCPYAKADKEDYGSLTIKIEVTSSKWKGVKLFIITGKLERQGVLKILKIKAKVL